MRMLFQGRGSKEHRPSKGNHLIWGKVETRMEDKSGSSTSDGTNPGSGSRDKKEGRRSQFISSIVHLQNIQLLSGSSDDTSSSGANSHNSGKGSEQATLDSLKVKEVAKPAD
eukprot:CAMPEP_0179161196 /NCGR_PEP_ID=MMETSP0796-20121207/78883_1 /TAXON_ID=73915 /ORGANISM="Pyrodinium bahamense, Strain pbaha01" /LENGTH=111 /DNA_ID=CAMNT_0020863255 /DNA_START=131 /DNA_END=463 /DNA_ORIENTATION=-